MNYFFIGVLLVFPTLISLSTSATESPNICDLQTKIKLTLMGVSTVANDLILQIREQPNTDEPSLDRFSFWRVFGTDRKPSTDDTEDSFDESIIDHRIRDRVYRMNKFNEEIDSLVEKNGKSDQEWYIKDIESKKPIRMTDVRKTELDKLVEYCQPNGKPSNTKDCNDFMAAKDIKNFMCVFSNYYWRGLPLIYSPPKEKLANASVLKDVDFLTKKPFSRICSEDFLKSLLISKKSLNKDQKQSSWFVKQLDQVWTYQLHHRNDRIHTFYTEDVNQYTVYNLFQFNNYYDAMSCPIDCTLNSTLFILNYTDDAPDQSKFSFTPTDLTINRLMGCNKKSDPFDPIETLCIPDREFISVFSFGKEIYFQMESRFWRYNSRGFDRIRHDFMGPKLKPFRYDSDITGLLEKIGINTYKKVLAFSYNSGTFVKLCEENNNECQNTLRQSNDYHQVCLIGHSVHTHIANYKVKGVSFQYSPSGLKFIASDEQNECQQFYAEYSEKVTNYFEEKILPGLPKDNKNNGKSGDELNIISIAYKKPKARDYISVPIIYSIYEFFTMNNQEQFHYYVMVSFAKQENGNYPTPLKIANHKKFDVSFDQIYRTASLYEANDTIYLYTGKYLKKITADIKKTGNEYQVRDIQIYSILPFDSQIFYNWFLCPFKSSTSLVTIKRERVCHNNDKKLKKSMFVIGQQIYYQLGQHFYKFINKKEHFSYDKYVSDLFNDYFDTRHRVTAMSVPSEGIDYVYVHGKSHHNYKHFGPYIYGLFKIKSSEFHTLEASDTEGFGTKGKVFGIGAYNGSDHFLQSIAYWQKTATQQKYPPHFVIFFTFYDFYKYPIKSDLKLRIYSNKEINSNNFMFNDTFATDWNVVELGIKGNPSFPIDEIVGALPVPQDFYNQLKDSVLEYNPLMLVAKKFGANHMVFTSTGDHGAAKREHGPLDFGYFERKKEFIDLFCRKSEAQSSESMDSGFKTANFTLAVLIMIVLSLVLVIAFLSYRRNQKQIEQKLNAIQTKSESEHQSVGQHSNQMDAKPEETSAQNSDTSSKTSDSLSTRSQ